MLYAPVYKPAVLAGVRASYETALARFGPRGVDEKGKDIESESPKRGRKTVRDSQLLSRTRSRSRKAVSDSSCNGRSLLSFRLRCSAVAMDEDSDIELIPDPGNAEKQQCSGGGPRAKPALKSQGKSFRRILTRIH